ncbi:hypothetical protein ACLOAV_007089 [Pseudogymnoascus australis]
MTVAEIHEWLALKYPEYQYRKYNIRKVLNSRNSRFVIANRDRIAGLPARWIIRPETETQLLKRFSGPPRSRIIRQIYGGPSQEIHCILCRRSFKCHKSFVAHQREAHSDGASLSPATNKETGSFDHAPAAVTSDPGAGTHGGWRHDEERELDYDANADRFTTGDETIRDTLFVEDAASSQIVDDNDSVESILAEKQGVDERNYFIHGTVTLTTSPGAAAGSAIVPHLMEIEVHSQSQRDSLDSGAITNTTTSLFLVEMASIVGNPGSLATGITDHTRSMFRAILAENGIADADEATLEQEMVMFFKFTRSHRIRLGRPGDFANCPVIIDADDDMSDVITKTIVPSISQSPPPSPPPSSPSPPPASPPPPPPPPTPPSRHSLRGTSGIVENFGGMDGRHKKKRKRGAQGGGMDGRHKRKPKLGAQGGGSSSKLPSITASIKDLAPGASTAGVGESALPQAQSALIPPTETTESLVRAGPSYQTTQSLEGGMSEILRPEDAVDIMTSVLLSTAKVRIQAGKFGFKSVNLTTTTNTVKIRGYTALMELPFKDATDMIAKSGAGSVGIGLQKSWEEACYWEIIEKYAATLGPMSISTGPHDGLTSQEKVAAFEFIQLTGNGTEQTSEETQRRSRVWWKDLSDMKNAGVVCILLYRNSRFNKFCKDFPRRKQSYRELINIIVSWEAVYSNHIKQIELRAIAHAQGNYSGWLDRLQVTEQLTISESNWDNGSNVWHCYDEEEAWKLTRNCAATSAESTPKLLTKDAYIESGTNRSFFISIQPGISKLVSVFPVVPIDPGDVLGIFSGKIRFSERYNVAQSITGPAPHLWLDYSQMTGTLNQMLVAQPGGAANVYLTWEGVNEDVEGGPCEIWRVLVVAIRKIIPFEPLVRVASSEEQFALHQSPEYARRGFLEAF